MKTAKGFTEMLKEYKKDFKKEFTEVFNIIKKPIAKNIFNSKVEVFGFSLKDSSDFFFDGETIEEIQDIIDLNEFVFVTKKQ